jgi:hypothetical protein
MNPVGLSWRHERRPLLTLSIVRGYQREFVGDEFGIRGASLEGYGRAYVQKWAQAQIIRDVCQELRCEYQRRPLYSSSATASPPKAGGQM